MITIEFYDDAVIFQKDNHNEANDWMESAFIILSEYCSREYLQEPSKQKAHQFYLNILRTIPVDNVKIPWEEVTIWWHENEMHASEEKSSMINM